MRRQFWLFKALAALLCVNLILAFPSAIVESVSKDTLGFPESTPERITIEIIQDENSELLQNPDNLVNGTAININESSTDLKDITELTDTNSEEILQGDGKENKDDSKDASKVNSQTENEGTALVQESAIIKTEKSTILEEETSIGSSSQQRINPLDQYSIPINLDVPEKLNEKNTTVALERLETDGHSNETSESTIIKSVENEMSEVIEEQTASGGVEYDSTENIHNMDHNKEHILTTHEKINDTNFQIHPISINSVKSDSTVYGGNISECSNREYDHSTVFSVPNTYDTDIKNKKIVARSMKLTKNSDNTDHGSHKQKGNTEYHSSESHYAAIDDSSYYEDDYVEDFASSLQAENSQLLIDSNELLTYDESPQTLVRTEESDSVKNNKDYVEQKNINKFYKQKNSNKYKNQEKKLKETNANQKRIASNRSAALSQIDLELSEIEDTDYDETFSGEIFDASSSKGSNKETVCTCHKNGNRKNQFKDQKDVFTFDPISNQGSGTQNLNSATVLSQMLRKNGGIQSLNNNELGSESVIVTQSSGVSPLLITSQPINADALSVLRQLGARQRENTANVLSNQNSRARNPSETINNRPLSSSQLSRISTAIQRVLLNGNNAANVANIQNSNMGNTLVVIEDLESGETIYFVENSGNIFALENLLPGSQITNIVGFAVNQQSGNLVPITLTSPNSGNSNLLNSQNSDTSSIQRILQNLISPEVVVTPQSPSLNTATQMLTNSLLNSSNGQISNAANVQVTQNTQDILRTVQNTNNGGQPGIFLSNLPVSQNLNNANANSPNSGNLGALQNFNNARIVASQPSIQQISGIQSSNNNGVIVIQSSVGGRSSQLGSNAGNLPPFQAFSPNGGIVYTQQTDNVLPAQLISQNANGNILVTQIGNTVAIQTNSQNLNNDNILVSQNNFPQTSNNANILVNPNNGGNTNIPQNINTITAGQTGNLVGIQTAPQNSNNILVNQNNSNNPQTINNLGVGQNENSVRIQSITQNSNTNVLVNQNNGNNPQNINNLGTGQTGNLVGISTAPQNFNANNLVSQNSGNIPQNINTASAGRTVNSVGIQSTSQNSNANIFVNQNSGVNGNPLSVPQTFNNLGTVFSGQPGNSLSTQATPQNSNSIFVNQNNGNNPQNVNNLGAVETGNLPASPTSPQNSNANILVTQNNLQNINNLGAGQLGNSANIQATPQNLNTNVLINENNGNNPQNINNLGAGQTGGNPTTTQNANILVNQNNGNNPQDINTPSSGQTNSVAIQSTSQNSNTNVLVNQNNANNPQNINNLGTGQSGNLVGVPTALQNSNANILVNQNSLGVVPTGQSGNTVAIQTAPQNPNNNNILVNQDSRANGNILTIPQNFDNLGTGQTRNSVTIQTGAQNSNSNPQVLGNQNTNNIGATLAGQAGNSITVQSPSQNSNIELNQGGVGNPSLGPQNIIGNVLVTQDSLTGNLVLRPQSSTNNGDIGNSLQPSQNNLGVLTTGQSGNSVLVQTTSQNSINGNIPINQINGGNLLLGPQNINNGNVIVTQDSVTGNLVLRNQNGNTIGIIRTQQTGNPLTIQSTQNSNNANIAVGQNEVGNSLLPNSQNVNNVGVIVNQERAALGSNQSGAQNTNNANILVTQSGDLRDAGVDVVSQQARNVLPGQITQIPFQTNNAGNIFTTLPRNNAGDVVNQQFGATLPAQIPLNGGQFGNLPFNDVFPFGLTSPNPNCRDVFLSQFSRNPISLQLPGNAGFLRVLGNNNGFGPVGNVGLDERFGPDFPNSQPFLGSNLGLPELLPNGLIAIATSGNPEFTILPETLLPNGFNRDSKLPFNVATQDSNIFGVPTEADQVYNKNLNSVTSSQEPFGRTYSGPNQYATLPHPCNTPIIHKSKPYVNDIRHEYVESPFTYRRDHPNWSTLGKSSIEDFTEHIPYERDSKTYKSNFPDYSDSVSGKPLKEFDTFTKVHSQPCGIHRGGALSNGHYHHSDGFVSGLKPKLYKYEGKVKN